MTDDETTNRRGVLKYAGIVGAVSLAGCSMFGGDESASPPPTRTATETATTTGTATETPTESTETERETETEGAETTTAARRDVLDPLTSRPSFASPAVAPERTAVAYWWIPGRPPLTVPELDPPMGAGADVMAGGTPRRGSNPETSGDPTTDAPPSPELRIYDAGSDQQRTVPTGETPLRGGEPIAWSDDRLRAIQRTNLVYLSLDGTFERVEIPVPDVSPNFLNVSNVGPNERRAIAFEIPPNPGVESPDLQLVDVESGELTELTQYSPGTGAQFGPDGNWIVHREDPEMTFHEGRLVVVDSDGGREKTFNVGDPERRTRVYGWHPDGRRLVVTDRSTGWYRVGLHDWRTGETTWFGSGDRNEQPIAVSPDGDRIAVVRSHLPELTDSVVVYDAETTEPVGEIDREGVYNGLAYLGTTGFVGENGIAVEHETGTSSARLQYHDFGSGSTTTIADTHTDELGGIDLVEPEAVAFETAEGVTMNARLHRPPTETAPGFVFVRGGPTGSSELTLHVLSQYLAAQGYNVLTPNYRGSTTRDRDHEEAIRGFVGVRDTLDVEASGRWLADREFVDDDRMAVMGHSYGGRAAGMQAVYNPDLWDLVCLHNAGVKLEPENANPYGKRRLLTDEMEAGPNLIELAADIDVPLSLLYGERDPSLDGHARPLAEALEARGWTEGEEFEFHTFEREGHVFRNKEPLYTAIVEALDAYL
jgi:dipeptidyl aminopeptidase/acylaminoacyl peptidase